METTPTAPTPTPTPAPDSGYARIKPEFVVKSTLEENLGEGEGPQVKKLKISEEETPKKEKQRGQNKHKDRPRPHKFLNDAKLCPYLVDGFCSESESKCPYLKTCHFQHDVEQYLATKTEVLPASEQCYNFQTYGKCSRGLTCLFALSHTTTTTGDDGKVTNVNTIDADRWAEMRPAFEASHKVLINNEQKVALRKKTFDFKSVEKIYASSENANGETKTCGAITDADLINLKPNEVKKIDWSDKLYLSPLTTVGNLPFRRLCVELGADITCSEMSLASSILHGNAAEFALHRRHPSEKCWGVQLAANNGMMSAKAAHILAECGIDYDFVDLNMGCPLDHIYRMGCGSGLMDRQPKFRSLVKGMTKVLAAKDKSFTVKMRTGVKLEKNTAHTFIEYCRDNGVSAVTLHGRTREQRYLRNADWNYIGICAKFARPMALFGNGDILSWEDYKEKKELSNVTGVMIGRGALFKPWIFQEIKEQRNIDLNSSQRLELLRKYANYGLDHWGSDSQGVSTTRRFLLEFLSFYHRYIPVGILENPPQKINQRPPKYFGRDEMETLLASPNSADWVKISEMFLGPVPDYFRFVPKHKANVGPTE